MTRINDDHLVQIVEGLTPQADQLVFMDENNGEEVTFPREDWLRLHKVVTSLIRAHSLDEPITTEEELEVKVFKAGDDVTVEMIRALLAPVHSGHPLRDSYEAAANPARPVPSQRRPADPFADGFR